MSRALSRHGRSGYGMTLPLAGLAILLAHGCGSGPDDEPDRNGNVKIIDDRPGASVCVDPMQLADPAADVNNLPQGEVALDVAPDGRLAAGAKDMRYGPPGDPGYNRRVWNGLYLSSDGGASWTNRLYQDRSPNRPLEAVTAGAYGLPPDTPVRLDHQSDPALGFDRDGNLYTCGLAYQNALGDPSAIVVSRMDREGRLVEGSTHLLGLEADGAFFDDKNWIAVDRDSPQSSTIVVASWRLFTDQESLDGGTIAVSADGGATYSAPIRLPLSPTEMADTQFFQPFIGHDLATGRKSLFVAYSRYAGPNGGMSMGLVKAPVDELAPGTAALHARLSDARSWTVLPERIDGVRQLGSGGLGGSFRYTSFFYPALDPDSGLIFAVVSGLAPDAARGRILAFRSEDGGASFSGPSLVDNPSAGHQLMPAVAAADGVVSVLWYDTRHDPAFTPQGLIHGIDVYYAELDPALSQTRLLRLTPSTQRADLPAFTVQSDEKALNGGGSDWEPWNQPHEGIAERRKEAEAEAEAAACEPYGFIGDYIGLAVDREHAYAAWCDLRDLSGQADICQGGNCGGRRNQNIYFARIPKSGA